MAFDDESVPPPKDPPKVIFHGKSEKYLPEEIRRVFGTNPPPNSSKPKPPPPPPPNSYHQKPKYWQMRGTGHMSQTNRIAGVMTGFLVVLSYLLYKQQTWGTRKWAKYTGFADVTEESLKEEWRRKQLWWDMVRNVPETEFATDFKGQRYFNPRKDDIQTRWDIREVDRRIVGIVDMGNPNDDAL